MNENNLISIQHYAIKHKMSTFSVIKQINAGKLKTIKHDDQEYIVDESVAPIVVTKMPIQEEESEEKTTDVIDYEKEFHKLLSKYIELQEKYTRLIEEKKEK